MCCNATGYQINFPEGFKLVKPALISPPLSISHTETVHAAQPFSLYITYLYTVGKSVEVCDLYVYPIPVGDGIEPHQ